LNVRKSFFFVLFVFIAGLALGFFIGALGGRSRGNGELGARLEQVNRDLSAAVESQREAAQRAARLQTELQGITDYARSLEEGTRRAEARTASIAEHLDGIIDQSGELADGINRAYDRIEESRILLDELGTLLLGLQGNGGTQNQKP